MSLPPLVAPGAPLSAGQVRRYARHLALPELGMAGQQRLENAKVLVVGAGGLGSPALMYLAAAGVGTLGIADFDSVEESNLQRQVVHGRSDVGRPKAESAGAAVRERNPSVEILLHEQRLDATNAIDTFAAYDLVLDGTDNFATRYVVNDACVALDKPYVWGSVSRFDGQASVFWARHGPCYRCVHPQPPPAGAVPGCAEAGVLGALCGVVGSVMAAEAVKLLTGVGQPLVGRILLHDALEMRFDVVTVRADPGCASCRPRRETRSRVAAPPPTPEPTAAGSAISVEQLRDWLAERARGERNFMLVDVREPYEYQINRIPGSVLVPRAELRAGRALELLPADRPVVLHCKSGRRSAEVLAEMHAAGRLDTLHVEGGVDAWVERVEPELPTY